MRLIDGGQPKFEYVFQCTGCKNQLVADANDVKVGYFGANYGGDRPERKYYVECPVCGRCHVLDRVPHDVIALINRKAQQ